MRRRIFGESLHPWQHASFLSLHYEQIADLFGAAHPALVLLLATGFFAAVIKNWRLALWLMIPIVSYHVVFLELSRLSFSRFLFPHLTILAIVCGLGLADILEKVSRTLRISMFAGIVAIAGVSVMPIYLLLFHDTRMIAEQQFQIHEPGPIMKLSTIEAFYPPFSMDASDELQKSRYLLWASETAGFGPEEFILPGRIVFYRGYRFDLIDEVTPRQLPNWLTWRVWPRIPGLNQHFRLYEIRQNKVQ